MRKCKLCQKIKSIVQNERIQIGVCFAFLLFMMVFNLMHSSLWGDEWVEYYYSQRAIKTGDMHAAIVSTFQPPLYNVLMHFWLKISQSLVWFRFFNVVLGFIAAVFIYKTNQKLHGRRMGLITVAILAVCYQWIYFIQECSEYTLMLMWLCAAIYFYVSCCEEFSYRMMAGFVLSSVLAIYSQYGSVFVAVPLLALFFFRTVFNAEVHLKRKIIVLATYGFSFIAFAIPLYVFYLREQMENNAISDNTVSFSGETIRDIPFVFGQIIGFFFGVNDGAVWPVVLSIISVIILALCIMIVINNKVDWTKKSIIIVLLVAYVLHFLLVQMHVYAMAHPGKSAGFFVRYSLFYIPLCCVAFPIVGTECRAIFDEFASWKKIAIAGVAVCILATSFVTVINNWNKALDDKFIKIWEENEGWKDQTYLFGVDYGFYYYVKQLDNYDESFLEKATKKIDLNNLPERFWAWRINWGGDGWQRTIDKARNLGYTVTVYVDSNYNGQLAFCELEEQS